MAIKAKSCFLPSSPSNWVHKVFLTCDNRIAVQFNHGQKDKKIADHGPGAYRGQGGVPGVCCLYPGTQGPLAKQLYELAQVWAFAGEWVHRFLYRKFGYTLIAPPQPCGNCNTECSLSSSDNPAYPGENITFTAIITNTDGRPGFGAAPWGTVRFSVDGTVVCTVDLPELDPDNTNVRTAACTWSTNTAGSYAVSATFTPGTNSGFLTTTCSLTQVIGAQCGHCVTVPNQYQVSLPGVGNVSCTDCGNLDGAVLTYVDTCSWRSQPALYCNPPGEDVAFSILNGGILGQLDFGVDNVTYQADTTNWDCQTPLTLNLATTPTNLNCTGYPATATLTPV